MVVVGEPSPRLWKPHRFLDGKLLEFVIFLLIAYPMYKRMTRNKRSQGFWIPKLEKSLEQYEL